MSIWLLILLILVLLILYFILPLFAVAFGIKPVRDLKESEAGEEKDSEKSFKGGYYRKHLYPTMSSLRRLGSNTYLLDYQYDYDIDDLMAKGVSSAAELLVYASGHILKNGHKFRMGKWGMGCSAFKAVNENGDNIMGRNFDYKDSPCYVVWTHPKNGYAAISMVDGNFMLTTDKIKPNSLLGRRQALLSPYLCLDGMNEKGLAICVLQIHADGTKQNTGKTHMFTTAMIRCCLDKCENVEQAINLFGQFDIQDTVAFGNSLGCCFHYLLTDAGGDAAVIEYVGGEMRVIRGDNLRVTNFFLAPDGKEHTSRYDPEGMERYGDMTAALERNGGALDFEQVFQLLSRVHLNYRHNNNLYDVTTLWSCLYNNDKLTMSMAARMDYDDIYTFSVTEPMKLHSHDSVAVSTPKEGLGYR